jgi:hemerythrin superfamily protein
MSQAGRRLVDDHEDLHQLLEKLKKALAETDTGVAREMLDLFWARLAVHIRAEHVRLFPAVLDAARKNSSISLETAQSVIAQLREDHDFFMHELASAISKDGELSTIIKGVEERLDAHNELEEKQIYALIGSILSEEQQAQLASQINEELLKRPPRFTAEVWLG